MLRALRHLWWLLVLPGFAMAQAQCTLYQATREPMWGNGPGPVELSFAAAEADAETILMASSVHSASAPTTRYGFAFSCPVNANGGASCKLSYGLRNPDGSGVPPPSAWFTNSIVKFTGNCLPQTYSVVRAAPPNGGACTNTCVGDPIDPALGNVYKREEDDLHARGASPIRFQRFYNSSDKAGADMAPGWRHSYTRSIAVNYQASQPLIFAGTTISGQYADPATACTSGFADIQGSVTAWTGATATYSNSTCVISKGGGTITTLQINAAYLDPPQATVVEYDVTRDDGQTFRYTNQGGTVTAPPGVALSLVVTGSGFKLTDELDNVETYDSNGVLRSIASRSGIVQTLSYDTNGLLSTVTDSFGNVLTLSRNGLWQLGGVSINGGDTVQFGYDTFGTAAPGNRLSTVTHTNPTTTLRYVYNNPNFSNALTSEIDENGVTYATWDYDSQERGKDSALAGGAYAVSLDYSNNPNSTTVTDALGAVRTFSFGRLGDQMPVIGIGGSPCLDCEDAAATTYDAAGWVASRADNNGNLTCYANDPVRGLELVRIEGFGPGSTCPTDIAGYVPQSGTAQRKIATTWHTIYRLPTLITEGSRTTSFGYDASGNLLTQTVTDTTATPNVSRTWTYTYNSLGQVLTAQGPRTDVNSTTTYTYYNCTTGTNCGQIQTVTDALGHVTTFNTYNAYGQPLTMTDPNGTVMTLAYDGRQRLTSHSIAGETLGIAYYPTEQVKKITLPDGSFIQYAYDSAHRLTGVTDGLGNQIAYTPDALGNQTAIQAFDSSNALAFAQTRVFNTLSELQQQIGSAGTSAVTTTFGYDNNGSLTSTSAPLARNSADQYDALSRLIQVTDPGSGVTQFGYDTNDRLISVVDPRSLSTSYSYNGFGDLVQLNSPDTGVSANTFDSAGNLATSTDARNKTGTYTYDAENRVTQVAYGDQTLTFGYDSGTNGVGHLTSAGDANHSIAWSYDALGRVVSKTQTVGTGASAVTKSVTFGYTNGDLTSLVTPSGQTVTYGYTNGQITNIAINGQSLLSQVLFQPFGPVSGWTWANNTTEARVYDQDGNLTNLESAEGFTYSYDNAFRITGITDIDNSALSQSFGYDPLDRLTGATGTSLNETWTYDAKGNRMTQGGATSSTYTVSPTSNQISGIAGSLSRTYGYSASGQTTSYGGLTFTYMNSGRLSSVTGGGATTTYLTNALGQRVQKSGTSVTLFVYDESGHLLGEYDGAGNLIEETVWMGDVPVAVLQPSGTGVTMYYVHADHLNSPRRISRPADNVIVWRWDSEPYGTAAANQDPDGDGTLFVYNPRFPGQYYDAETGLNYNYFRDYDPGTGRYIQSDPIGLRGGINTYAYVAGNPLAFIDPLGMDIAVAVGMQRTDSYNIAGHVADAVTGGGVFSFGTGTPLGSSFVDYLNSQSEYRGQVVYDIKTTPEQDAAALAYLRSKKDDIGKLDNCAFRTYQSLRAAHVRIGEPVAPTPAALQQVLNALVAQGLATAAYIPINGQIPDVSGFNP